ncbi:ROK family protein [Paenibacillus glycinis]|uniref:ROK family protein n=1 Tax=Paenibacillus glycinis TaxID=2697035 RepID=A0ABW9XQ22_9BACL|nr:ROK family protein [Paenibacillus glycinis]NBD24651.1 ROK family protein [Paenibacillus glycinis]
MEIIYIGIDLGGTKMLAAIVDAGGKLIAKAKEETLAERGAADTINRMEAMVRRLLAETFASSSAYAVWGIGIAVAGILDPRQGTVVLATNLRWENVPLGRLFRARFDCPVQVMNDANAAALGEWMAGTGAGAKDLIFVTVSTGIGGGIISGGRLVLGASNSAAELGHISIDRHGPLCACGNRGCIELYASGNSIARIVRDEIAAGETGGEAILRLAGGDPERLTAEHVAAAASQGSAYAADKLAQAGAALGIGMISMIHLMNPKLVILGGGVSRSGRLLLDPMRETVKQYGIPGLVDGVEFKQAQLGEDAGGVGAALWWRYAEQPVPVV